MVNSNGRNNRGQYKPGPFVGRISPKSLELGIERDIDLRVGHIAVAHGHVVLTRARAYPRSDNRAWAMRSHVVWWLHTDEFISGENISWDIHHRNEDKLDDRFLNLDKLRHDEHARLHNPKGLNMIDAVCIHCGVSFKKDGWRVKEGSWPKFCSQICYHAHPRSTAHKENIRRGMKLTYLEGRR